MLIRLINLHRHTIWLSSRKVGANDHLFLHPVTSSASAVSEFEREEPGGESLSPPVTPNCKKTQHHDSGFRSACPDEFPLLPIG